MVSRQSAILTFGWVAMLLLLASCASEPRLDVRVQPNTDISRNLAELAQVASRNAGKPQAILIVYGDEREIESFRQSELLEPTSHSGRLD